MCPFQCCTIMYIIIIYALTCKKDFNLIVGQGGILTALCTYIIIKYFIFYRLIMWTFLTRKVNSRTRPKNWLESSADISLLQFYWYWHICWLISYKKLQH